MDTGLFWREKRPLKMYAKNARLGSGIHGRHRGGHLIEAVADQCRQEPGRPKLAMCRDHCTNGIRRRFIGEQEIATAIDLNVDKTGSEPRLTGEFTHRHRLWNLAVRNDSCDLASVDQNC